MSNQTEAQIKQQRRSEVESLAERLLVHRQFNEVGDVWKLAEEFYVEAYRRRRVG